MKADFFLNWYRVHKRDFPWRHTKNPYKIWVSEVMLQQTQANRVVDFYFNFLKKFPNLEKFATVSWSKIFSVVRGMGYYGRFRNMQQTAQILQKKLRGKFPQDYTDLRKLPGIGDYTANALLAFAFGKHVPVIDTNVRRVLQHFYKEKDEKSLRELALKLCPKDKTRGFFQALMDYAQTLKKPSGREKPQFHQSLQKKRLLRRSRTRAPLMDTVIRVAAGIIHRYGKILIQQRNSGEHLGGLWEFPGGKLENGEDARACLKREIKEELGIEVSVRPHFCKVDYEYADRRVKLTFHRCQILLGKPKTREGQKFVWVVPAEIKKYRFAPANRSVLKHF